MKQSSLLLALFLLANVSQAQNRLVLYEEFTSETCPPSRFADSTLWALLGNESNASNVEFITFVTPIPTDGGLYSSDYADYDARSHYYNINAVSTGRLDGVIPDTQTIWHGAVSYLTQPMLDTEKAKPSPFNIEADCAFDLSGRRITINVHVSCVSDYAPHPQRVKLYAALVKTLDYIRPPGTNGQTHFEHMVRAMYPNSSGTVIDSAWHAGDTASYRLVGVVLNEAADSMRNPHTSSPGYVVVWIQNDSDFTVAQAAKAIPPDPSVVSGINTISNAEAGAFYLFPSPAKDQVELAMNVELSGNTVITILDLSGQEVYRENRMVTSGAKIQPIATGKFASGEYIVSLENSGRIFSSRFVVTR